MNEVVARVLLAHPDAQQAYHTDAAFHAAIQVLSDAIPAFVGVMVQQSKDRQRRTEEAIRQSMINEMAKVKYTGP